MLDNVVYAVECGQEGGQIVPKATKGPFQETHASRGDQLLAEMIEKRVHVDVCKSSANINSPWGNFVGSLGGSLVFLFAVFRGLGFVNNRQRVRDARCVVLKLSLEE